MDTLKGRILQAAVVMIDEKGVSFRMDDLAKVLSISKRTLYEVFRSKHEIIETIIFKGAEEFYAHHQRIVEDISLSLQDVLEAYFQVRSHLYEAINGENFQKMFDAVPDLKERLHDIFQNDWILLEKYLQKQQDEGNINQSVEVSTIITILQGSVRLSIHNKESNCEVLYTIMPKVISVLLNGIRNKGDKNEEKNL